MAAVMKVLNKQSQMLTENIPPGWRLAYDHQQFTVRTIFESLDSFRPDIRNEYSGSK
jgi:hypothetical protein